MPVTARLRGFEPHVPEDLQVTFSDDLPSDVVCAQCDNVSATLHRDPVGHGYCTSCMKMCRRNGLFECFTCGNTYTSSELQIDRSPRTKLRAMKIVCPRASKGKPVHIPLYSLQDHLQSCSCDQVPQANEASHQQTTVGDSLGEQEPSGSQNSLSGELKNALDQKESNIQLVTEAMQSYKADVSTLNKELSQQKSDIQQLTETVKLHDSDMKYLQAELTQKESHIQLLMDTVESYRTDITDMFKTIQETVSMLNKETKIRLQKIEDVLEGMDNRIEAAHIQLQEESKQSDDAQEKCNNKILQLQAAFDNLLCQISPP